MDVRHLLDSARALAGRARPAPSWSEAETVLALAIAVYGDPARLGGTKVRRDGSTRQDPVVQRVAEAVGRTDDAVVLKVMNLRTILTGGERGMSHGSRTDMRVVEDYAQHLDDLVAAITVVEQAAPAARGTLEALTVVPSDMDVPGFPSEPHAGEPLVTERLAWQAQRVGQGLFRSRVLRNFGHACGFCGLQSRKPESNSFLLVASHVLPWRTATSHQRLDPSNGVALCAIHDRAFDWGFMTLDDTLSIKVSAAAERHYAPQERVEAELLRFDGQPLREHAVPPAEPYLAHHREAVFDRRFRQAARG